MRPTASRLIAPLLLLLLLPAAPARAQIAVGANAPAFSKSVLGGGTATLSQYSGKVVVLFLLGYGCPFCQGDAPSVQQNIHAWYQAQRPGEVQVLGADLWNGTAAQMNQFKSNTGVQFPLLLNGALAAGGNMESLYGTYDNYIVIDQGGVVRYHAALQWPHGNRYHLNEIRDVVDALLGPPLDVPGTGRAGLSLAVSPHPSRGPVSIAFTLPAPSEDVAIEVLDSGGRRVARLWSGAAPASLRLTWPARDARGDAVPAGLYFVRAAAGATTLVQRVVVLR